MCKRFVCWTLQNTGGRNKRFFQRNGDVVYHIHELEASTLLVYKYSPILEYIKCSPDPNSCKLFCRYQKADVQISSERQRD